MQTVSSNTFAGESKNNKNFSGKTFFANGILKLPGFLVVISTDSSPQYLQLCSYYPVMKGIVI